MNTANPGHIYEQRGFIIKSSFIINYCENKAYSIPMGIKNAQKKY